LGTRKPKGLNREANITVFYARGRNISAVSKL
jgi:hypothetical protein